MAVHRRLRKPRSISSVPVSKVGCLPGCGAPNKPNNQLVAFSMLAAVTVGDAIVTPAADAASHDDRDSVVGQV
jgi:hypothetical protein